MPNQKKKFFHSFVVSLPLFVLCSALLNFAPESGKTSSWHQILSPPLTSLINPLPIAFAQGRLGASPPARETDHTNSYGGAARRSADEAPATNSGGYRPPSAPAERNDARSGEANHRLRGTNVRSFSENGSRRRGYSRDTRYDSSYDRPKSSSRQDK